MNKSLFHDLLGVHYIQDHSNYSTPPGITEYVEFAFGNLIIGLAIFGFVVNCCALVILHRKNLNTVFHQLLRFLSVYDILVCLCGCLTYGLPPVWNLYKDEVLTRIGPWINPITHAALMTSVYCTVILSLERYVRICYLCQLREWSYPYITVKNVNCYKLGLVIIPLIFYLPKFFELRWVYHKVDVNVTIDCEKTLSEAVQLISTNFTDGFDEPESLATVMAAMSFLRQSPLSQTFLECVNLQSEGRNNFLVTESREVFELMPTNLRMNSFYYKFYCVFLNSTLASFLPLAALLYLNTCTVKALKNMSFSRPFIPLQSQHQSKFKEQKEKQKFQHETVVIVEKKQNPNGIPVETNKGTVLKSKRSYSLASMQDNPNEVTAASHNFNSEEFFCLQTGTLEWTSMGVDDEKADHMKNIFNNLHSWNLSIDEKYPGEMRSCPEIGNIEIIQCQPPSHFTNAHQSMTNLYLKDYQGKNIPRTISGLASDQPQIPRQERILSNASELNGLNHVMQHNNAQEQRLARISTSIVWLFIMCHIWRMIPTVYEYLNSDNGLEVAVWPIALDVIEHISHSLILTNSAVNFLIYVFM